MDAPCGLYSPLLPPTIIPPSFSLLLWMMTVVIPKHQILFHKARRLCITLSCIYMLLVTLGATPFAQAQ